MSDSNSQPPSQANTDSKDGDSAPGLQPEASWAFAGLSPDLLLDAVESAGFMPDGHLLALNSYENRVYQVGIEDSTPLILKIYRPKRWSDAAIAEEHRFTQALVEHEIPVIAPLPLANGDTLWEYQGYRFTLFPRQGGHAPEFEDPEQLEMLGRFMARIHNVGASEAYQQRPALSLEDFGEQSIATTQNSGFIPEELRPAYDSVCLDVLERCRTCFHDAGDIKTLRLHGDAHVGNILATPDGLVFVDFDDSRTGPAIQDLWMFLSGERRDRNNQLIDLLEGYTQFREFDPRELHLIEALRSMRLLHHSAWIARRWQDPAFPRAFGFFAEPRYWEEQILTLREQIAAMDEAPLIWD